MNPRNVTFGCNITKYLMSYLGCLISKILGFFSFHCCVVKTERFSLCSKYLRSCVAFSTMPLEIIIDPAQLINLLASWRNHSCMSYVLELIFPFPEEYPLRIGFTKSLCSYYRNATQRLFYSCRTPLSSSTSNSHNPLIRI